MIYNNKYTALETLQLLSSSICNISCGFCYLQNQNEKNAYTVYNEEIQQAWLNGTYLDNIKKVFKKLNSNPEKMRIVSLWGGEPLILIKNVINSIEELITFFPNLEQFFIATNFSLIENFANLVYSISEARKKTNNKNILEIKLQLSIDAPPGEMHDFGHFVDWDIYKKNIEKLCLELSNYAIAENIKINLHLHGVCAFKNIKQYLNTYDKISNYCDYFYDFTTYINNVINKYKMNKNIYVSMPTIFPFLPDPDFYSMEDGMELTKILKLVDYMQIHKKYNLPDKLSNLTTNYYVGDSLLFDGNRICRSNNGISGITLLPDGTICTCFSDYILNSELYWKDISNNPLKRKLYRQSLLYKRFYYNPLKMSEKEENEYQWYIQENIKNNKSTTEHLIFNLAVEMAKSGQIDITYFQDLNLLLKDLKQFNHEWYCLMDLFKTTLNSHIVSPDILRRNFNGCARWGQTTYLENERWNIKWDLKDIHI